MFLGQGGGTFNPAPKPTLNVGLEPYAITADRLTNSGNDDLIVANRHGNTLSVLLGQGDGTFGSGTALNVGYFPEAVAVGDFNGDGHPDLAVANFRDGSVSILLGLCPTQQRRHSVRH